MNDKYLDILFEIYQSCKHIPGWLDNLRQCHDEEDMEYFEKLVKLGG